MAKISRRNFLKSAGLIGLGVAGSVEIGSELKYLMAQQKPPEPPMLKSATVDQDAPPEKPLENHLPEIYKKLGEKGTTLYATNGCNYDPKDNDLVRVIVQLNRKEGKGYLNVIARRFLADDELFKSSDQEVLKKLFERGSMVKQFNVFGEKAWGEQPGNNNYICPENNFAPVGIGEVIKYAVRKEFSQYTACITQNIQ